MLSAHLRRLWAGQPTLARIFWQDMLIGGTAISLTASVVALLMFAADASTIAAIAVFFAPFPYNALLVTAVWRSAARDPSQWSRPARVGAVAWLFLVTLI
jgi:hypothetical protein